MSFNVVLEILKLPSSLKLLFIASILSVNPQHKRSNSGIHHISAVLTVLEAELDEANVLRRIS